MKITKSELLRRIEALEEWASGADEMLTELNHALPDPEYDAMCEENAVAVEDSLDRRAARLGLKNPELTGSGYYHSRIASKLLERGQKLVMCFVSNVSESDALNEKTIEVITSVDAEFNDADDYGWQFVVPINNQGEPLTQAEVGL
ncbi:hypothetical protein ACTXMF_12210 [Psychrobacter celer]|uniref:hypothetical protein n=1 Tax=Psychrobacter celer TaxID=306572 RepID=UPI003FD64635